MNKDYLESFKYEYKGRFFDLFHAYEGYSIVIPFNLDKNNFHFLNINFVDDSSEIVSFNRIKSTKFDVDLIGKWKALDDYEILNYKTYFYYNSNGVNNFEYTRSKDSISKFLDYRNIQFTEDFRFIRNTDNSIISQNILMSPFKNKIFIENDRLDFQYFNIISISNDSLKVKLSVPNLTINYVRETSNGSNEPSSRQFVTGGEYE
ncbi:hypothetical protein BTO06_03610 [Tenacibaculum sp. SZ-18]|uniref:hypothetical protein n=1 Tax=Tenacibaculum sp. SZ-18 TaxID=754423 RepID=UPI000C2D1304|nr:hypothetical protein [Tenacibaculum sp. SZ-18]AUC14283.1 hypothetical protein BTO06_03610 [Tenacibaculum sp. SZ-18]